MSMTRAGRARGALVASALVGVSGALAALAVPTGAEAQRTTGVFAGYGRAPRSYFYRHAPERPLRVTVRAPVEVQGPIGAAIVRRIVLRNSGALVVCAEQSTAGVPDARVAGPLRVRFAVSGAGAVVASQALDAPPASWGPRGASAVQCMVGAIRRWEFPAIGPAVTLATVTLEFRR